MGNYLQGQQTDIPPGYIGEAYVNFHVLGIVTAMFLMGLLLRKTNELLSTGNPSAVLVYSVLAPFLLIFMGRSFIGGGTMVMINAGLLLPVIYLLRRQPEVKAPEWAPTTRGLPLQQSTQESQ